MATHTPEQYRERTEQVGEWEIRVTTYKLGEAYVCKVDNVNPGATLARVSMPTLEEAEAEALSKARHMIGKTRTTG